MQELQPIGWYARQIRAKLPDAVFKPVPQRLWGGLVYLVLTVGAIAAIALYDLPWYANLALAFLIGNTFAGLGFLGHEILHGTVVKNARLRDFLGGICFAQFSLGAKVWRKWHNMEHHAHTQHDDLDPDAWGTMDEIFQRPAMKWVYKLHPGFRSAFTFVSYTLFFSVHSFMMLQRFYKDFRPNERPIVLMQYLLPTGVWLTLLVVLGPYKWLFAYLIPLMVANFLVISYISTNHQLNPLTEVNDPLANSLSVTVPRWVDVLHFNFSYHTEHHLYPGVNPKWGPVIKAKIKETWPELYNEMPMSSALAMLWRTPRIYHNRQELIEPKFGAVYPTLGHGLKPGEATPRYVQVHKPASDAVPNQGD